MSEGSAQTAEMVTPWSSRSILRTTTTGSIFIQPKRARRIDDIKRDGRVCFEVDLPIAYVRGDIDPCKAAYRYQSIIILGRAHVVEDQAEQVSGLSCLMNKYQPEGGYGGFSEEKLKITGVVRIDIEEMVGKEDLDR